MPNFIPYYVYERISRKEYTGNILGGKIFCDISGFTSLTESLMAKGKEGAEEISQLLSSIFSPVAEFASTYNGFIANFAGDAFTLIFPQKSKTELFQLSSYVLSLMEKKIAEQEYPLGVRGWIAEGEIEWGIITEGETKKLYFKGKPLLELGEIIKERAPPPPSHKSKEQKVPQEFQLYFVPEEILHFSSLGEFRYVVPVFVGFDETDENWKRTVKLGLREAKFYGGYFNKVEFGDKGALFLVLFGAPTSYENNISRAIEFALSLKRQARVKIGIASGVAYTGILGGTQRCEYTAIGDTVNTSARLMEQAEWGEILVENKAQMEVRRSYSFSKAQEKKLKGKKEAVQFYLLIGSSPEPPEEWYARFIGREDEQNTILQWCAPLQKGESPHILYIHGEPGIGKTRFVRETLRNIEGKPIYLQPKEFSRRLFDPVIRASQELLQADPKFSQHKYEHADAIHFLLGMNNSRSSYERLDPKAKFEVGILALTEFLLRATQNLSLIHI